MTEVDRPKIFRDPIHGFISISRDTPLRVIDTPEFQRLRRIRQLGLTSLTYHGGEHNRFSHSIGVYHLFRRVAERLRQIGVPLSGRLELAGGLAALLHDIGHGPFSHVMEKVLTPRSHLSWTIEIITSEESQVNAVLRKVDSQLPEDVASILRGGSDDEDERILCKNLVSSQFDVDRMDYLLRDSYGTGSSYGRYDLDRVLATLQVYNNQLVFGDQYLAEQFIFARYFAYWQVYFHKTTRGFERVAEAVWLRAKRLFQDGKLNPTPRSLTPFLRGTATLTDYIRADDSDIYMALKEWSHCADPVLSDLSLRLLNRMAFKCIDVTSSGRLDISEIAKNVLRVNGYSEPEFYFLVDRSSDVAYDYYITREEEEKPPVLAYDPNERRAIEISKISNAVRAIAGQRLTRTRVYLPDERCRTELKKRIGLGGTPDV